MFLVYSQDKYKRALAENENIRKRLMKQIEEAKLFGIQGFVKDLLEVDCAHFIFRMLYTH